MLRRERPRAVGPPLAGGVRLFAGQSGGVARQLRLPVGTGGPHRPINRTERWPTAALGSPAGPGQDPGGDPGGQEARALPVPRYLLLNGTEPRWRLHDTVDSADLEKSLARVMKNGVILYTLASRNEGETFQSLTINGKNLVTYVITEDDDPDPAKTRSRYEAAGF